MAKFRVKLSLGNIVISALVALARLIVTKMTGNPNFPAPNPALGDISTAADELEAAKADVDAKRSAYKTAVTVQKQKKTKLKDLLTREGKYVELNSDGDKVKIESAGMAVFNTPGARIGTLPKVLGLQLKHGDAPGEIDMQWQPVKKRTNYTIQVTMTDPSDSASVWQVKAHPSKSSCTIQNLSSGQRVWVRVCANGTDGPGAFSDAKSIIVP
jgi:hypothetical protein